MHTISTSSDTAQALQQWVAVALQQDSVAQLDWQPLVGDASFRRYFRCHVDGQSYIAALAPPVTEKNSEFIAVSKLLAEAGVQAPKVIAYDLEQGYLLQTDLGHQLLADVLDADSVDAWYRLAMDMLVDLQALPDAQVESLGHYNTQPLALELSYFKTWFVEQLLDVTLSDEETAMLDHFFDGLVSALVQQPRGFVHRDFHSRNIMVVDGALATIDFQDALFGPMTYDLVSLLRDCYVQWPLENIEQWTAYFYKQLQQAHPEKVSGIDLTTFQTGFDLMGLQRHIKVLGVFARLAIRDGKASYLSDLPLVMFYVRTVAAKHPMAEEFLQWFDTRLLPFAKQQDWGASL